MVKFVAFCTFIYKKDFICIGNSYNNLIRINGSCLSAQYCVSFNILTNLKTAWWWWFSCQVLPYS